MIEPLFFFSLVWGAGASVDGKSRPKFETWMRGMLAQHNAHGAMPADGTVYDWAFVESECAWRKWMDTIPPFRLT